MVAVTVTGILGAFKRGFVSYTFVHVLIFSHSFLCLCLECWCILDIQVTEGHQGATGAHQEEEHLLGRSV